jgi:hypothetical protein
MTFPKDKIIYYHGHSNPCVVGEICIPTNLEQDPSGFEVIAITHNMIYQDYGDSLSDITKIWDAHVQIELTNINRYDTDYDSCIHIPLNIGEYTTLSNQILKQILLDNNVRFVIIPDHCIQPHLFTLNEFNTKYLGVKKEMQQSQFDFMKDIPKDYEAIAKNLGSLLNQKQAAYGDAFGNMEQVVNVFYPHGIKPHQYKNVLTLVRILDKMFRISNLPESNKDRMDEDPWKDIAGYAILALSQLKK